MIRKRFFVVYIAILLCLSSGFAQAHTYRITVIVDTDMALDDMRALAMLLNSDMLDIPLIVTSDGSISPQAGCRNLGTLLQYFKRQDTKIARGKELGKPPPSWRSLSENVKWHEPPGVPGRVSAGQAAPAEIVNTLESMDEDVLYLCLGPLTNLAEALRLNPEIKERISRLIYYGAHPDDPLPAPFCSCTDQGNGTIVCEGGFSDGDSAAGMRIQVVDADGKIILAGYMNENSEFSFKKPEGGYVVIFDVGPGHIAKVPSSEITE